MALEVVVDTREQNGLHDPDLLQALDRARHTLYGLPVGSVKAGRSLSLVDILKEIHQALNDGQRQIELLNRELQHHRFGADRETFRFDDSAWIPEYRDYARFFEEVMKIPALGEETLLFNAQLSTRSSRRAGVT